MRLVERLGWLPLWSLRMPRLLQGDFDMGPTTLRERGWPLGQQGACLGPGVPTCYAEGQRREFDWFASSNSLGHAARSCEAPAGYALHPRQPALLLALVQARGHYTKQWQGSGGEGGEEEPPAARIIPLY